LGDILKILLHSDNQKTIEKSGVGRAIKHQMRALELNDVEYTTNPDDDYDIIHINTIFLESYLMGVKAKMHGKKVIFHGHSTEEDFRNSFILSNQVAPLFKVWLKTCYSSADLVLTPTPYSKRLLEDYDLEKPIIDISNGIDLSFFAKDEKYAETFRNRFGFSKNDKIIISVGLFIERKGILDFVELAKRHPEYKFVWFGHTNLRMIPKKIKDAVKTELPNLFFPGYVSKEVLKGAYSFASLFLFPTFEETEGIVLLEALAMKIPTLIRDIPIYEGWLEDGKNVYKAKKLEHFSEKITAIIEGKLPNLVEEGYKVAEERDIKIIGAKLKEIYTNLFKESSK
jgi:1,2-diacylglycerol-3-alpha-glucose alpha-1,2-glucosyltransferase